eukprot:351672-Chlamydomonas_euryale.AAC.6
MSELPIGAAAKAAAGAAAGCSPPSPALAACAAAQQTMVPPTHRASAPAPPLHTQAPKSRASSETLQAQRAQAHGAANTRACSPCCPLAETLT